MIGAFGQEPVACGGGDEVVELLVHVEEHREVFVFRDRTDLHSKRLESPSFAFGAPDSSQFRCLLFNRLACLENGLNVVQAQFGNCQSTSWKDLDDVLVCQPLNGLPNRCPADAEMANKVLFVNNLTRPQSANHDHFADLVVRFLGRRELV